MRRSSNGIKLNSSFIIRDYDGGKRRPLAKHAFNDITSISSYSRENELVEYGYSRDHEDLPQINLGLIVDSGSHLPLHYHVHDGDIHDVTTLKQVLKEGLLTT